jgi:serine protease inhibitor
LEFKKILSNHFHTDLEQLNFEEAEKSAEIINNWVAEVTRDKIKDLISPSKKFQDQYIHTMQNHDFSFLPPCDSYLSYILYFVCTLS